MERSKAIELLSLFHKTGFTGAIPDFTQAVVLGINALKIIDACYQATLAGKDVYIVFDKDGDPACIENYKR